MKYDKLDRYLEKKGLKAEIESNKIKKEKSIGKSFANLSAKEKDALLEQIAKNLGYL